MAQSLNGKRNWAFWIADFAAGAAIKHNVNFRMSGLIPDLRASPQSNFS